MLDISTLVSKLEGIAAPVESFLQAHRDLIDAGKAVVAQVQAPPTKEGVLAEVSRLLDVLKTL